MFFFVNTDILLYVEEGMSPNFDLYPGLCQEKVGSVQKLAGFSVWKLCGRGLPGVSAQKTQSVSAWEEHLHVILDWFCS